MSYYFSSSYDIIGEFPCKYSNDEIKNETMFWGSSLNFAYEKGNAITRGFIDSLPKSWKNCNPILDSKVHMLMPGVLPCIGGWHHDDIARDESGQPNYKNLKYKSEHLMGLVNADLAPTIFAIGSHTLPDFDNQKEICYAKWHPVVEEQVKNRILVEEKISSGKLIEFNWQSIHRGTEATKIGWRWFIRLSRNTDRQNDFKNEIRNQVQVYVPRPNEGW